MEACGVWARTRSTVHIANNVSKTAVNDGRMKPPGATNRGELGFANHLIHHRSFSRYAGRMLKGRSMKVAALLATIALVAASLSAPGWPPWLFVVLFVFGAVNLAFEPPWPIVPVSVGATIATMAWPRLAGWTTLYIFLVWPLWVLLTRSRDHDQGEPAAIDTQMSSGRRARTVAAGLFVAVAAGSVSYRLLVNHRLEQTAALFIGIPTLLAVLVIFLVRPRS